MADRNTDPNHSVGARPIEAPARKYPAWLIPLIAAIVLIIILLLLLSRCGGSSDASSTAPATTASATTAPANVAATAPATAVATASSDPATTGATTGAGAGRGIVTANGQPLLPLADATRVDANGDLSAYTGTMAKATAVQVQSVPANEGFWVGASDTDRVWVQLTGKGESPYTVKKRDAVSFTGKVVKNTAGFAEAVGVSDPEGGKLLDSQGQHIDVAQNGLALAK